MCKVFWFCSVFVLNCTVQQTRLLLCLGPIILTGLHIKLLKRSLRSVSEQYGITCQVCIMIHLSNWASFSWLNSEKAWKFKYAIEHGTGTERLVKKARFFFKYLWPVHFVCILYYSAFGVLALLNNSLSYRH